MTVPFTKLDIPLSRLAVVCRGCLAESGEMKNIYEWGIHDDYFRVTAIEVSLLRFPFFLKRVLT